MAAQNLFSTPGVHAALVGERVRVRDRDRDRDRDRVRVRVTKINVEK